MKTFNHLSKAIAILCLSLALPGISLAEENSGQKLFESMKCQKCHAADKDLRGPSLVTMANVYPDADTMLHYFSGEGEPIVDPKRARTMKPRLKKIIKLSDADKKNLASYIMSFKKTP